VSGSVDGWYEWRSGCRYGRQRVQYPTAPSCTSGAAPPLLEGATVVAQHHDSDAADITRHARLP
jgi:hypothetical protein